MRQPPDHRVPGRALASAATTPFVRLDNPAPETRPIGLQPLPEHFEPEIIVTTILGRPRPLPGHRRADRTTPSTAKSRETSDAEEERFDRLEEGTLDIAWTDLWGGSIGVDGISPPELHILLGLAILLLGGLRAAWRMIAPLTGLALVAVSDDLVGLHIAAHIAFFVALGAHLLLVLRRGLLPRMLPGVAYVRKGQA